MNPYIEAVLEEIQEILGLEFFDREQRFDLEDVLSGVLDTGIASGYGDGREDGYDQGFADAEDEHLDK